MGLDFENLYGRNTIGNTVLKEFMQYSLWRLKFKYVFLYKVVKSTVVGSVKEESSLGKEDILEYSL
jgi:hypothetical protein